MPTSKFRALMILVLAALTTLSACNYPGLSGSGNDDTPEADAVMTQIAQTIEAEITPPGEPAESPAAPTDTSIIPPTLGPTQPPAPATVEPSPGQPVIRAEVDTNCRQGPSTLYKVVGYLLVGGESTVHGRKNDNTWWYIATPKKPGTYCWAWGGSTRVEGDTSQLPVITPPPSPTLTPTAGAISIAASFSNVHSCGGTPTAIFQITNTGTVTIESVSLVIEDLDSSAIVYSSSSNAPFFAAPGGCPPGAAALGPGATGYVGGEIGPLPSGTNMRATAQLCPGDNLSGDCLVYQFNWGIP